MPWVGVYVAVTVGLLVLEMSSGQGIVEVDVVVVVGTIIVVIRIVVWIVGLGSSNGSGLWGLKWVGLAAEIVRCCEDPNTRLNGQFSTISHCLVVIKTSLAHRVQDGLSCWLKASELIQVVALMVDVPCPDGRCEPIYIGGE
nr:hypothetical protein [Tanacetum cinerariifolium]